MASKIECRYEYWGSNGKEWTPWHNMFSHQYAVREDAENAIRLLNTRKPINKLKHEYRITDYD